MTKLISKIISIVCYLFVAVVVLKACSSCAKQDTTKVEEQQIIPEEEHFPCPCCIDDVCESESI